MSYDSSVLVKLEEKIHNSLFKVFLQKRGQEFLENLGTIKTQTSWLRSPFELSLLGYLPGCRPGSEPILSSGSTDSCLSGTPFM